MLYEGVQHNFQEIALNLSCIVRQDIYRGIDSAGFVVPELGNLSINHQFVLLLHESLAIYVKSEA